MDMDEIIDRICDTYETDVVGVAKELGVTVRTVFNWCAGNSAPCLMRSHLINEVYLVPLEDLKCPEYPDTIGGRLLRYRVKYRLTQSQFAEILGIPVSTYNGWELDKFVPQVFWLKHVCEALEIQPTDLYGCVVNPLVEYRINHGLSQEELASYCNVDRTVYGKVELGVLRASDNTATRISDATGVSRETIQELVKVDRI